MSLLEERALARDELVTEKGTARLWTLSEVVYVSRVTGYMGERHADFFERFAEERLRSTRQKLNVFHDWLEMTGYESKTRLRMTRWSVAHLDRFDEVHIAQKSKLVAMGIQVANIALGGKIRMHPTLAQLDAELRRVIVRSRDSLRPPSEDGE